MDPISNDMRARLQSLSETAFGLVTEISSTVGAHVMKACGDRDMNLVVGVVAQVFVAVGAKTMKASGQTKEHLNAIVDPIFDENAD